MAGIRINTPWVRDMESRSQRRYDEFRRIMAESGMDLPHYNNLSKKSKDLLFDQEGNIVQQGVDQEVLDMQRLSRDIYAPNICHVIDGKNSHYALKFYVPHLSNMYADFGNKRKKNMKELSAIEIDWLETEPVWDLRVTLMSKDYEKKTVTTMKNVQEENGMYFLNDLIRQTARYLRHEGYPLPHHL